MSKSKRILLLTGPPGVGKTTIIQKLSSQLLEAKIQINGFYTEEVRSNGVRIGFDVVPLQDRLLRKPLARIMQLDSVTAKGPMVGKYTVDITSFEQIAIPLLKNEANVIYVIDEIGKMELQSNKFKTTIETLISNPEVTILATIPIETRKPIPIISTFRNHPNTQLFVVSKGNRNFLPEEILNEIKKCI